MKSSSLLPLYNQLLTYKQADNGDDRDEDEIVKDVLETYGGNKHKYLRFVLFPDIYPPCRPPTVFPYPTHIFRDVGSMNFTASGGALYLAWAPFGRFYNNKVSSTLTSWNGSNAVVPGNANIATYITGEEHKVFDAPTLTGIDTEHVRGIGAFIQVSYIGRMDELAGTIEVGVAIEDAVSADATQTRYVATSKLKGLYQYKRMDVATGVRCVWLPLSVASLEAVGATPSTHSLNQVYHVHILGASASPNVFRVDYGYYYDGIVDEEGYNTLMPKRAPKDSMTRDAVIKTVNDFSQDVAVTPANPMENGFASSIWNTVKTSFNKHLPHFLDMGMTAGVGALQNGAFFLK